MLTPPVGLRTSDEDLWALVADRRSTVARNWLAVSAFAVVCAILTFLGASFVPATYGASAVVRVTTGVGALASRDSVTASNDLAAQFSQLIETAEVKDQAARRAGVPVEAVQGHVSATVLSSQNLIQITARAPSGKDAAAIAGAAATVLTQMAQEALQDTVTPVVQAQLKQLDTAVKESQKELKRLQREAAKTELGTTRAVAAQAEVNNMSQKISQLQYRMLQLQQDNLISNAQRQILLNDLGPSGPPHKESPRPVLYALIALALAAVVGTQVGVTLSSGRRGV